MALPQTIVVALLLIWGRPWHALAVAVLLGLQFAAMRVLFRDPKGKAPWYNGTGGDALRRRHDDLGLRAARPRRSAMNALVALDRPARSRADGARRDRRADNVDAQPAHGRRTRPSGRPAGTSRGPTLRHPDHTGRTGAFSPTAAGTGPGGSSAAWRPSGPGPSARRPLFRFSRRPSGSGSRFSVFAYALIGLGGRRVWHLASGAACHRHRTRTPCGRRDDHMADDDLRHRGSPPPAWGRCSTPIPTSFSSKIVGVVVLGAFLMTLLAVQGIEGRVRVEPEPAPVPFREGAGRDLGRAHVAELYDLRLSLDDRLFHAGAHSGALRRSRLRLHAGSVDVAGRRAEWWRVPRDGRRRHRRNRASAGFAPELGHRRVPSDRRAHSA